MRSSEVMFFLSKKNSRAVSLSPTRLKESTALTEKRVRRAGWSGAPSQRLAIAVHVKYRGAGRARRPAQEVLAHELFRHERLQDAGRLLSEAEVTVLPRGQIQPWFVRVLPRDQRAAGPHKACRPLGQSAEQRLHLQRGHLRRLDEVEHVAAHALLIEADLAKEGRDHYQ